MLFSGYLACFSPSVDPAIRKLWVKNGGTLTHTDADFRKAQFFFCNGMDDAWLNELLSRSLIVRHSSWVTLSVDEEFCMPIAAYTLDDGFDESKIRILDPSSLLQGQSHQLRDAERMQLDTETKPFPVNSRKRRIADEDDSQRVKKKARTDDPNFAEVNTHGQSQLQPYVGPSGQLPKPVVPNTKEIVKSTTNRISFLLKSIHSGKVSNDRKVFESCLVYSKTPPILKKPKNAAYSPLNPHNLFWNDLLAKCCARDGATSLNLSVEDLLGAPETKAVIFDVNKTYLGKRFLNMDYS